MSLKNLLAKKKPILHKLPAWSPTFVIDLIRTADNRVEHERTDSEYTHVSAMIGWCPREVALTHQFANKVHQIVSSEQRVMWALGRAAEHHVRQSIITTVGMDRVYGGWSCPCKTSKLYGFGRPLAKCPVCKQPVDVYGEHVTRSDKYRVQGSIDLIIVPWGSKAVVVEIKSITNSASANQKKEGFDTLAGPMGNHVYQASMYQRLLSEELPGGISEVYEEPAVLYVSKDFKWGSLPYKEFHVPFCDKRYKLQTGELKEAKKVWLASSGRSGLPTRVCPSIGCSRAKGCPLVTECFNLQ